MTTLDKADIQEQTAHIGRTNVGTVPPGRLQPIKPPIPYAYALTRLEPVRPPITYTFLNFPNDTYPTSDCVYFMYSAGRIKIGFSNGVDQRQLALAGAGPFPPVVVLIMRGSIKDERAMHQKFASARLHGEWFALDKKLRSYLSSRLCDVGRASLDKAEAEFRDFCKGFLDGYKAPKRKPRPSCDHGKPYGNHCYICERNVAEARIKLIRDHLANPTPENTAAVEAECFSPRPPSQGEAA